MQKSSVSSIEIRLRCRPSVDLLILYLSDVIPSSTSHHIAISSSTRKRLPTHSLPKSLQSDFRGIVRDFMPSAKDLQPGKIVLRLEQTSSFLIDGII